MFLHIYIHNCFIHYLHYSTMYLTVTPNTSASCGKLQNTPLNTSLRYTSCSRWWCTELCSCQFLVSPHKLCTSVAKPVFRFLLMGFYKENGPYQPAFLLHLLFIVELVGYLHYELGLQRCYVEKHSIVFCWIVVFAL